MDLPWPSDFDVGDDEASSHFPNGHTLPFAMGCRGPDVVVAREKGFLVLQFVPDVVAGRMTRQDQRSSAPSTRPGVEPYEYYGGSA